MSIATGVLPIANGGTGADNAPDARSNLGIGSGTGNTDIIDVDFNYSSSSPIVITLLNVGDVVEAAEVEVLTAFNGGSPTVSIGTAVSTQRFVANTTIASAGYQDFGGGETISTAVNAILTIALGGSTAGSGRISLTVSRA